MLAFGQRLRRLTALTDRGQTAGDVDTIGSTSSFVPVFRTSPDLRRFRQPITAVVGPRMFLVGRADHAVRLPRQASYIILGLSQRLVLGSLKKNGCDPEDRRRCRPRLDKRNRAGWQTPLNGCTTTSKA